MSESKSQMLEVPESPQLSIASCSSKPQRSEIASSTRSLVPLPSKPYLRYFAVGPSTYKILCPLCHQRSDTQTVELLGVFGPFSCLLSSLSCCFPLFSLSLVYLCLQNRCKAKRFFCSKCGGHLGFYSRSI